MLVYGWAQTNFAIKKDRNCPGIYIYIINFHELQVSTLNDLENFMRTIRGKINFLLVTILLVFILKISNSNSK